MVSFESTKAFFVKCRRVWSTLKKPTKKEFQTIAKVSAIGILLFGLFGFIISLIVNALIK